MIALPDVDRTLLDNDRIMDLSDIDWRTNLGG